MLNDKQEKFAQSYVLHNNATEAAKSAGYAAASAANQGYRLLQINEISERIRILELELETNVDVIDELESQYAFAKQNGHTNSAIKALELLSKCDFADSLFSEEDLEDMSTESLLESVTEGVVDPTYPEDTTSPVTGLEENT